MLTVTHLHHFTINCFCNESIALRKRKTTMGPVPGASTWADDHWSVTLTKLTVANLPLFRQK